MNEILKMLNTLTADELEGVLMRGNIMLEKKRKEEAEEALREKERLRQQKIEEERLRQEEIANLQRKLQELQNQKIIIPEVEGDGFVMHDEHKEAAAQTAAAKPVQPAPVVQEMIACPHCGMKNVPGSRFCANCGQEMVKKQSAPAPAAPVQEKNEKMVCPHCRYVNEAGSLFCAGCGQRMTAQQAPVTPPAAQPSVSPAPQTAAAPRANAAQVRYADESMKKWVMNQGEQSMRGRHEITMKQPDGGKKFAYYMEITNQRILLSREGSFSKNMTMAGTLGGGIVGGLIVGGVKAAAGAGPKPWLEIPLAAISNYGVQNKKEFFIVADQTYVFKNIGYDNLLPDLIANAKK